MTDARVALIDAIASDMQRGRSYYDAVIRQLLALRKTFTDPPPYTGLVLASDLTAAEARIVELEAWRDQVCVLLGMGIFDSHSDKTPADVQNFVLDIKQRDCQRIEAAEAVADRRLEMLRQARATLESVMAIDSMTGSDSIACHKEYRSTIAAIDAELTGTPVADGGEGS